VLAAWFAPAASPPAGPPSSLHPQFGLLALLLWPRAGSQSAAGRTDDPAQKGCRADRRRILAHATRRTIRLVWAIRGVQSISDDLKVSCGPMVVKS
jgi:hypothetical protein